MPRNKQHKPRAGLGAVEARDLGPSASSPRAEDLDVIDNDDGDDALEREIHEATANGRKRRYGDTSNPKEQ